MLVVPSIDKLLGIEVYATKTSGIGGVIRESVEDFMVEEVLVDGSKAQLQASAPSRVLNSTLSRQRFLLCILVKHNWDTFIAVKNIAKQLAIEQGKIQFSGIKDAKAITAQYITIDNASMEDLTKVKIKDIEVHPVGYVREMLSVFYLLGNNFIITTKCLDKPIEIIEEQIMQTLKELEVVGGIPNFFGHQRFGTTRPITHLVGKAIVKGDFERAAMLFLAKSSADEHASSRKAREELQLTKNFKQALEIFPKQLRFERIMLYHLAENPRDFVGAFTKLPVKLQALFVQAHQSFLFNRFLSQRVKYGLLLDKAEVGDYVVKVERTGLPMTNMSKIATPETLTEFNEQIKAGKMRVALPIIGIKQKLSGGIMGELERKVLEEENDDVENLRFNVLSRAGRKGGLRTCASPVKDFKLQNILSCTSCRKKQAQVNFMLLRGSYATVLLREIMKPPNPITAGF
jgi:tRNA pseudouridine13 synthase